MSWLSGTALSREARDSVGAQPEPASCVLARDIAFEKREADGRQLPAD